MIDSGYFGLNETSSVMKIVAAGLSFVVLATLRKLNLIGGFGSPTELRGCPRSSRPRNHTILFQTFEVFVARTRFSNITVSNPSVANPKTQPDVAGFFVHHFRLYRWVYH